MAVTDEQLVDVAIQQGLIAPDALATLRVQARRDRIGLLEAVTGHGRFPVATLYRALAVARGIPYWDATVGTPSADLLGRFPREMVQFLRVLPIDEDGESVRIATSDPDDRPTLEAVERVLGRPVRIMLADPGALDDAIARVLDGSEQRALVAVSLPAADPVGLLDRIFQEAFLRNASDIHFEPQTHGLRVRVRVDGRLQHVQTLAGDEGAAIVSRVKVLAGLDIAEQRAPQDGGFSYRLSRMADRPIDIRVATTPSRWGERATLRLLGLETHALTLEHLGMREGDVRRFRSTITRPYGLILLTGPTGSGKSTTLYAALREINRPDLNILTVEDPIEYTIPGISQVEVDGNKVTFASTLRALLRHDPDVLMIGEIRDAETADIALKAALTGHLVFSTLHTSSACGAVTRLRDLGCQSYLIASSLCAVIAQRLVRRLCPRCRRARPVGLRERAWLQVAEGSVDVWDPGGCAGCMGTGYRGRIGLFETLWIDRAMTQHIARGATEEELARVGSERLTPLLLDGRAKVLGGLSSMEEVLGVTITEPVQWLGDDGGSAHGVL